MKRGQKFLARGEDCMNMKYLDIILKAVALKIKILLNIDPEKLDRDNIFIQPKPNKQST